MDLFEETGMRGLANKLGLKYIGYPRDDEYIAESGGLPKVPLLAEVGERDVSDLMYGRLNGANAQLFNVLIDPYEPEPRHGERSCVAVTFAANFPRVLIGPHTRMSRLRQKTAWKGLRNIPDDFKQRFNIETADPDAAAVILDQGISDWMLNQQVDIRLELQGGAMLGHVPRLEDDEFTELVDLVQGFHRRIPEAAWAEYSLFKLG